MFSDNKKISLRQLKLLMVLDIFGTAIIYLPRQVCLYTGRDGWIAVLAGGLAASAVIYLLAELAQGLAPSFKLHLSKRVGGKVSYLIFSLLALKLCISAAVMLRVLCEIIRQTMLFRTPIFVSSSAMAALCLYSVFSGYEARARTAEIIIIYVAVSLLFVFILTTINTDFTNLSPILKTDMPNFLKGAWASFLSFGSMWIIVLAWPYVNKGDLIKRQAVSAGVFLSVLLSAATALIIARFGADEVAVRLWPVLQMMDTIDFPGAFIERQDFLMMGILIFSVFSYVGAGIYFSALLLRRENAKAVPLKYGGLSAVLIVLVSLCIKNSNELKLFFLNNRNIDAAVLLLFIVFAVYSAIKVRIR